MRSRAVISSKGQIAIPASPPKRYHLKEGTAIPFQQERGRLILAPNNYEAIYALEGSVREFPLEASLDAERRPERKRENER